MNDLAKVYAHALFQLATEKDVRKETADTLKTVDGILRENGAYCQILRSPTIPMEERLSLLDAAFGGLDRPEVTSFLKLLCEKGHFALVHDCVREFFALEDAAEGRIPVTVCTALPPEDSQKEALREGLRKLTNKEPELTFVTDPGLIGGIRIQVGDRVLDGTLSGKLSMMKGVLNREQPC